MFKYFAMVRIHPKKGKQWICFLDKDYFDLYGCALHKQSLNYLKTLLGENFFSEYQKNCFVYIFVYISFILRF